MLCSSCYGLGQEGPVVRTYHACSAPDICRCPIASPNEHLETAVLPRLDVLCEVVVLHTETSVMLKICWHYSGN